MKERIERRLIQLNKSALSSTRRRIVSFLSLFVIFGVFWGLKLTGITMAGEAFCGFEEHVHGENCPKGRLICTLTETEGHTHDESCILRQLVCTQEESEAHTHDDSCLYRELICTLAETEGHTHDDNCRQRTLLCALEEAEGHSHSDECYAKNLICTEEGDHTHEDSCYENVLVCPLEETAGHAHSDECYTLSEEYVCGLDEAAPHTHTDECYTIHYDTFVCGKAETEGHKHTDECYYNGIGFGCGNADHAHTDECVTAETQLACGKTTAEAHTHTAECYETFEQCPLEEHIHTENCYSNIDADLENEEIWQDSIGEIADGLTTGEMIAAVARSQLGVGESQLNFEVDESGVRRGITRYGQWYGNPYGDWSAMFACFCLYYSGADGLPFNSGAEAMRLAWEELELYTPADISMPETGNLIFLRNLNSETDENAPEYTSDNAAAVAIVTDVTEDGITVIQGDYENTVAERTLALGDESIMGYALVPEMSPFALMALSAGDSAYLADTIDFSTSMFTSGRSFVIYAQSGGNYYALVSRPSTSIEATVEAVPITIDADGRIYSDYEDPEALLWNITRNGNNGYIIQNIATGRYLHPGGDNGVIYSGSWPTAINASGTGARLTHTSENKGILFNSNGTFTITSRNNASTLYFGMTERCTVYLDGTNGNLMSLGGADKDSISVVKGTTIVLPSQWKSPDKYSYTLKGWYDIANRVYYAPGDEVTVTEDMLFYADWAASTYDIGQMNEDVVGTVSTNEFITTHVFDYNSLFNTLSMNNNYTGGSGTRWTLIDDGTIQTTGEETLNFVFIDYDDPGNPGAISYPIDRNQAQGIDYSRVTPGLYNPKLAALLFDTKSAVPGKHYIGTGDHLFQYGSDPSDNEHYGYYYYDSMLNAASYNQSNSRFYVYDYLERTTDAQNNNSYSDFLPFNSPYANTNGKTTGTYYYDGVNGEYVGTPHIMYDSKYQDSDNSLNRIETNYWFGMSMDIEFYLPAVPGTVDSDGVLANQSIVGDNMVFEFSGDDDVWVLIDGELVLDIGGIHGVQTGYIDFSTGDVVVAGEKTNTVTNLSSGAHTLTMLYLERGSSLSNFKLRFNLSTRYAMTLRKEDTLSANLLNGAQFKVYTDPACTNAAQLYNSRSEHENDMDPTNRFTVENGKAEMWGLAAGNTYYLKEVRGPDSMQGVPAKGIIRMRLNNSGMPDYEVIPDNGDLTVGYTVHGYKVNEDMQEAYLVVTNTDATESKPTEVSVNKIWDDDEDHTYDSVTVYLIANGVRIQTVTLSKANNWSHTWVNLPETDRNGEKVIYTVREATVPGYIGDVKRAEASTFAATPAAAGFADGETYLLGTSYGYLGAVNNKLMLESDKSAAESSDNTLWVAKVNSDGTVTLTTKSGQTLYWDEWAFFASSTPSAYKNFNYANGTLSTYINNYNNFNGTCYPIDNGQVESNITYNQRIYSTNNSNEALAITPHLVGSSQPDTPTEYGENAFVITNTPVGDATISLKVKKIWDIGNLGTKEEYEEVGVKMELLENGLESGLTATLNLRNGWTYTFTQLPKFDSNGNEIAYTVREVDLHEVWRVEYGAVQSIDGSETAYETTVTNIYRETVELPSTGRRGAGGYIVLGLLIIFSSLGWYCGKRRKRGRREL